MKRTIKQVRQERRRAKSWGENAITFLCEYVMRNQAKKGDWLFAAEDVIRIAPVTLKAKDNRAWGSIFSAALRRGIIREDGFGTTLNARAHCRPVRLYRPGK